MIENILETPQCQSNSDHEKNNDFKNNDKRVKYPKFNALQLHNPIYIQSLELTNNNELTTPQC